MSIWPFRAASNNLAAKVRASRGNWSADAGGSEAAVVMPENRCGDVSMWTVGTAIQQAYKTDDAEAMKIID